VPAEARRALGQDGKPVYLYRLQVEAGAWLVRRRSQAGRLEQQTCNAWAARISIRGNRCCSLVPPGFGTTGQCGGEVTYLRRSEQMSLDVSPERVRSRFGRTLLSGLASYTGRRALAHSQGGRCVESGGCVAWKAPSQPRIPPSFLALGGADLVDYLTRCGGVARAKPGV
jgi:hypothetical protein